MSLPVVDSQAGTTSFGYDAQGNLASRNGVQYAFDTGNRLRNVAGEEGGYAYDAWGRRVAQTDTTGTIYSFYDRGGRLIYQRDRMGGTHDYLYLGGKLVAIRDYDTQGIARAMRYQHTDALGSVIRQTDKTGQEIANTGVVYDAWGGMHGVIPQDGPGYTGHVQDANTHLVYMQQRYYDPSVGRFLSMDPVDASGTDGANLDRYWYAKDNPYRYTDPFGLYKCGRNSDCPLVNKMMKSALKKLNTAIAYLRSGASFQDKIEASNLQGLVNFAKSDNLVVTTGAALAGNAAHTNAGAKGTVQTISLSPNTVKTQIARSVFAPVVSTENEVAAMTVHEVTLAQRAFTIGPSENTTQGYLQSERSAFLMQSQFNKGLQSNSAWGVWETGQPGSQNMRWINYEATQAAVADCSYNSGCSP